MRNILILSGYFLINTPLIQIAPTFHNHHPFFATLYLVTQASRYQLDKIIWTKIWMTISPSFNLWLIPKIKIMKVLRRHWRNMILSLSRPRQFLHRWWSRISIPIQTRRNKQIPKTLTLWYQIKSPHHWNLDITWKLVECGLSSMIPAQQNSMNHSPRQK